MITDLKILFKDEQNNSYAYEFGTMIQTKRSGLIALRALKKSEEYILAFKQELINKINDLLEEN